MYSLHVLDVFRKTPHSHAIAVDWNMHSINANDSSDSDAFSMSSMRRFCLFTPLSEMSRSLAISGIDMPCSNESSNIL